MTKVVSIEEVADDREMKKDVIIEVKSARAVIDKMRGSAIEAILTAVTRAIERREEMGESLAQDPNHPSKINTNPRTRADIKVVADEVAQVITAATKIKKEMRHTNSTKRRRRRNSWRQKRLQRLNCKV